jgi:hypothetical protein
MPSNPIVAAINQETMNSPAEQPNPIRGFGGGLADEVPAEIDGEQPAALSEGEFVFPADVVSFMGNGSSEAGSRVLNGIIYQVRSMMKKGGKEQSPPLSDLIGNVLGSTTK